MIKRNFEIVNRLGLHARAAAKLVHEAGRFKSEVSIIKDGEEVDAKSILGILLLAAGQGTEIEVACEGEDEDQAIQAIGGLIEGRFGEDS